MRAGLKESVIDPLKAGILNLDCGEICLTQDTSDNPRVFRGPGYISQDDDGNLVFKFYPPGANQQGIEALGTPGLLISPERFYTFTASDVQGNDWTGNRVLPDVSISHRGGHSVAMVHGRIHALTMNGPPMPAGIVSTLTLRFFTDQKIPCHSSTVIETNAAEHRIQRSSTMNLATITSCGCGFLLTQQSGEVVVEAWSREPFPAYFETRISEALQFVLAQPLQWSVLDSETSQGKTFQITSQLRQAKSRLQPPINLNAVVARYWTWILFDHYLRFIVGHSEADWHPCSVHLASVREASAASVDGEILAMTVAAEGLTKVLFPAIVALPEPFLRTVDGLKDAVDKWLESNKDAEDAGLTRRIPGLFSMLKEIRAIDRLVQLQKEGVIEQKHIDGWKKLRNAAAHAAAPGTREWQLLLDRRDLVVAMIYRVVFHAIGYEGRCSDYGTRLWPIIEFPKQEVTEQECEVGAIVCQTRAFGRQLEWSGPVDGPWEWTVSLDGVEQRGTAASKSQAAKAARSCAESRQINTVVQEKN